MLNLTKGFGKSIHGRERQKKILKIEKRKFLREVQTERPTGLESKE